MSAPEVRITSETDEHIDLLEVFEAASVTAIECPHCHAQANGVLDGDGKLLAISCPWCSALYEEDE